MQIARIDHLVLTTRDLERCVDFYGRVLGVPIVERNGRYEIRLGSTKINIHQRPGEFQPVAAIPQAGALDFCLVADTSIERVIAEVRERGWPIELGPVARHGALGAMTSIYLRDPDGNLVEIAHYDESASSS